MAKADYTIEPKTVIIKNPAKNYGLPKEPVRRWVGDATSWEQRVRFGKHMPTPWLKEYECLADCEEMANQLLSRLAARDGYALGGILNIRREEK